MRNAEKEEGKERLRSTIAQMQAIDVPIMSIQKLAEATGLKVSFIKTMIAEGEIPLKKRLGGYQKIKVINLEAFRDQCRQEGIEEQHKMRKAIERRIIRG